MPKTPSKMRMYDMVKIDTTVFEIMGGGACLLKPPPQIVNYCLKHPGLVRVNKYIFSVDKILKMYCMCMY